MSNNATCTNYGFSKINTPYGNIPMFISFARMYNHHRSFARGYPVHKNVLVRERLYLIKFEDFHVFRDVFFKVEEPENPATARFFRLCTYPELFHHDTRWTTRFGSVCTYIYILLFLPFPRSPYPGGRVLHESPKQKKKTPSITEERRVIQP